jgi:steroid delta-isomerase-like uncharacterized protein
MLQDGRGQPARTKRGKEQLSMSAEEYKALVRRGWEEVINRRNLDFLAEAHPADAIWYEPDQDIQGIEQMKHYLALTFKAFPDFNVSVEDVIAEGEKVVSRYTFRGTHQGETEEFGPPTGRQFELEGISMHRFEDGKIVEDWERYDNLSLLQQLGLVPEEQ